MLSPRIFTYSGTTCKFISQCWNDNTVISFRRNCFDWEIPKISLPFKDLGCYSSMIKWRIILYGRCRKMESSQLWHIIRPLLIRELALTVSHGSSLRQQQVSVDSYGARTPVLLNREIYIFVLIFLLYCLIFKVLHPHICLLFKVLILTLISKGFVMPCTDDIWNP